MRGPSFWAGSADFIGRRMAIFSSFCCGGPRRNARALAGETMVETGNKSTWFRRARLPNRAELRSNYSDSSNFVAKAAPVSRALRRRLIVIKPQPLLGDRVRVEIP